MILGKITFMLEHKRPRWDYCRPVANANKEPFPIRFGICHVVQVEKCELTKNVNENEEFTVYAIFDKKLTFQEYRNSYCKVRISPITEEVFNQLIKIYPQEEHAFCV